MNRRRLRQRAPNLGWALSALPFILMMIVGLIRLMTGPGYGLLPLSSEVAGRALAQTEGWPAPSRPPVWSRSFG